MLSFAKQLPRTVVPRTATASACPSAAFKRAKARQTGAYNRPSTPSRSPLSDLHPTPLTRTGHHTMSTALPATPDNAAATSATATANAPPPPTGNSATTASTNPTTPDLLSVCSDVIAHVRQYSLVLPPLEGQAPGPGCLLLICPGGFIKPENYLELGRQVQRQVAGSGGLPGGLWVGVMALDWVALMGAMTKALPPGGPPNSFADLNEKAMEVGVPAALLDAAVSKVEEEAGFKAKRLGGRAGGRATNLVTLMHSAAGPFFSRAVFKGSGGGVLLSSAFSQDYNRHVYAHLEDWGRPVLIVGGDLDGQMQWFHQVPYMSQLAYMASRFGPEYAAVNKPLILLKGANHAQSSALGGGVPGATALSGPLAPALVNAVRGDVEADASAEETLAACSGALSAFLTTHFGAEAAARKAAAGKLLEQVTATADLMAPYARAAGYGDVSAPFNAAGTSTSSSWVPVAPYALQLPAAAGLPLGPMAAAAGSRESAALPSGVALAAEQAAVAAQQVLAAPLGAEAAAWLHVVASVHAQLEGLVYSQPTVSELPDGRLLVHVHVYSHFPLLEREPNGIAGLLPVGPNYWMKLKSTNMLALHLGTPPPEGGSGLFPEPGARAINEAVLRQALEAVPRHVLERYKRRGLQLHIGDDIDWLSEHKARTGGQQPAAAGTGPAPPQAGPPAPSGMPAPSGNPVLDFVQMSRLEFAVQVAGQDGQDGSTRVVLRSPCVQVPVPPGLTPGSGKSVKELEADAVRFAGSSYVKVLSPAAAMEWVWLACLRAPGTNKW
mmetsp:Transcript_14429/g.31242  ORF Transcript_14429/g.31242 Transcript_14429/m.31242 type:complete len:780 (+) Transcript_14429:257-2596(+)